MMLPEGKVVLAVLVESVAAATVWVLVPVARWWCWRQRSGGDARGAAQEL